MQTVPEYDLRNPATWTVVREAEVWSESEAAAFQAELVRIAGLNPFGKPNLVIRWAVTYEDPMMPDGRPKYYLSTNEPTLAGFHYRGPAGETVTVKDLADVPAHVLIAEPFYEETHLGERKFVVEQWRSADFLARSGRYRETHDTGEGYQTVACRNCGGRMQETGREDERACVECGSRRQSVVEHREIKSERLLNDLPAEGCYDFFMRLELPGDKFRPADAVALADIEREWRERQKPFAEKHATITRRRGQEADLKKRRKAAHLESVWHPDNLLNREKLCQQQ